MVSPHILILKVNVDSEGDICKTIWWVNAMVYMKLTTKGELNEKKENL